MKIHRSLQRYFFVTVGALTGLLTAASLVNFALAQGTEPTSSRDGHILTVYDRGVERVIVTKKSSVKEALDAADIEVDAGRDVVEPSLDTELIAPNYRINIYRARPITVVDGAVRKNVTTARQTASLIAKEANITLYPEDTVTFSSGENLLLDGANRVMTIDRATAIELTLYGKKTIVRTHTETVADLLLEKQIVLGANDTISVDKTTKIISGLAIEIWRNGTQTVTVEEPIAHPVEKIQDANREAGYRQVKEPGEDGSKNVTYEIEMKNGHEIARKVIASVTTKEPKKQVEIVGAKNNYSGSLNEWLLALRTCETHGNYQAATGNGYYGAYQFLPSTWNSIAKRTGRNDLVGILPSQAAPADQDAMVIANTNATAGLSTQHPGCYSKLGLANKPPGQ